jgi:hypothetical protein
MTARKIHHGGTENTEEGDLRVVSVSSVSL